MKGLNKIALATAVAAAPFATQAMEPMNDSQMGDVTGQAGVTIEMNAQVDIDRFTYSQDTEGSFVVDNISIGGLQRDDEGNIVSTFDASMDIDLDDDGDALISFGGFHNDEVLPIETTSGDAPVMLGFDMGSAGLEGQDDAKATLMSNFTADILLTQLDITASTLNLESGERNDAQGHIGIDVGFALDLDVDFDVAAVGLRDLSIGGVGTIAELEEGGAMTALAVHGRDDGVAVVNMTIAPGAPVGTYSGLDQQPDEALVVNVDNFAADMHIGEVRIGRDETTGGDSEIGANRSIGSVGLENLQVTNTRLAIYGRE